MGTTSSNLYLEDEKFMDSVKTFAAITHECLHSTDGETHHLTMADVLKELKKALTFQLIGVETILLEEVKSATDNFNDKRVIGSGASAKVYKGELTHFKTPKPVAVKRLNKAHPYGEGAFLKEVSKLSRYVHENIIALLGFCEVDDEKIIIMDYASNESLDKHLDKSILTWGIRLKISIGAAKGINHIHSFEEDQKTLHGDIKSSNILLDHDWKATISDFIISKSHGTVGYLDPQYSSSGATKASDVYSFAVVLFELLSGRLAIEKVEKYSHPTLRQIINEGDGVIDKNVVFLASMAARCFEDKKLEALLLDDIKEQTYAKSVYILSKVAYDCLQKDQEKRPTMTSVIQELEKALNIHEDWEFEQKLPKDNENILRMIKHQESKEITKKYLYSIFSSGIRINNGKVDGKVKEMISATMFSYENCWSSELKDLENSRFGTVARISDSLDLKIPIKIKTQFLSLGIIYGAYLVFKFCNSKLVSDKPYVNLKYRTASGKLSSRIAERRDGEWMIIELCRFRSHNQTIDFEAQLKSFCGHPCVSGPIFVDGIEFRPINNISSSIHILQLLVPWLIRFKEVVELQRHRAFSINCNIETKMLSPDTAYACYLVFQLPENSEGLKCPVKARDLLLNHDWEATISNFIISRSHGTLGYLDPQSYRGVTKKSDIYSFGVVLFEILSGKLAIENVEKYSHHTLRQIINDERERYARDGAEDKKLVFLAWMAARCFEENKLEALIFDDLTEQTDVKSIDVVSKVAYQCLNKDQEKRPTMALVIQELEKALIIHEEWECEQKLPEDYERIMKMIENPESQIITKKDLYSFLSSGTLLNNRKVWLSLSRDGKVNEMISETTFSYENFTSSELNVLENSRFGTVAKISKTHDLKISIKIKTQFLSLGIIYGAYLVFKFCDPQMVSSKPYLDLKYKTASGELNSYIAERRDGEWMMIELCRFRSDNQIIDLEVQLESLWGHPCGSGPIFVDGIEFRPIDNVEHEKSVDRSINADSSINWDQQLSSDFQEIMKRSQYDVLTMTKQELVSTGVLIDNGEKLFSLSKRNSKKCHMLPAKAVINKSLNAEYSKCQPSATSRFEEVVELQCHRAFSINCNIETKMLSTDTAYACYLVFQLPENSEGLKCPVKAQDLLNKNNKESTIIYLKAPGPVDLYRDKRVPENREDGWVEVRVWEFVYNNEIKDIYIPMELKLACLGGTMLGLIICGIEFRPI
ncbi:phloem protein 2-like protein [Tanacetum coccineum]